VLSHCSLSWTYCNRHLLEKRRTCLFCCVNRIQAEEVLFQSPTTPAHYQRLMLIRFRIIGGGHKDSSQDRFLVCVALPLIVGAQKGEGWSAGTADLQSPSLIFTYLIPDSFRFSLHTPELQLQGRNKVTELKLSPTALSEHLL